MDKNKKRSQTDVLVELHTTTTISQSCEKVHFTQLSGAAHIRQAVCFKLHLFRCNNLPQGQQEGKTWGYCNITVLTSLKHCHFDLTGSESSTSKIKSFSSHELAWSFFLT